MYFQDALTLDKDARICADGSLVAEVYAARTGLQDYLGIEVDPQGTRFARDKVVKVYRPESEVFKADSLATFSGAPITVDHPSDAVTADNWKALGVGEIHGDVVRDGQRVRVPIIVRDAAAVKAATTTHKQLSMGYATQLVFPADGKHPDGTVCDAYQTNLKINHIALVRAARGGPELRVVDERAPSEEKPVMAGTIVYDGIAVPLDNEAQVRAVFDKQTAAITDAKASAATAAAEHVAAIQTKDAEIVALTAKVADAEKAANPEAIDARVADRAALVGKAKVLKADIVIDGKTDAAIRKEIVEGKLGDAAKGFTTDAEYAAAFSVLTVSTDAIHKIAPPVIKDARADVEKARNARLAMLTAAHTA